MAAYGSYVEDYDDDEELGESYLDIDEDIDDFEEARRVLNRRRPSVRMPSRAGRGFTRHQSSDRRTSVGRPRPITPGSVKSAFKNVGQDVAVLDKRFKTIASKQSNDQLIEILSLLAFKPRPINVKLGTEIVDENKVKITEVTTGIENNLLPLILIKFLGTSGGRKTQQYLLIGLAAIILVPDLLSKVGLGGISATSTTRSVGTKSATTPPTIDTNILLLGGLIYLISVNNR